MITWIASYPRSGNTFLRIVMEIVFGVETTSHYPGDKQIADLEAARASDGMHFVKTHDPPPDDAPAVYLVRDGREALTSYQRFLLDYDDRNVPLLNVIAGLEGYGSWSEHLAAWQPLTRPRTLLIKYEELVADWQVVTQTLGEFIGRDPMSHEVPSFAELKQRDAKFYRSGRTDSWKSAFSDFDLELFWCLHGDQMQRHGYECDWQHDSQRQAAVLRSLAALARADRLEHQQMIEYLSKECEAVQRDREAKQEVVERLVSENDAVLADRAAKQQVIDRLIKQCDALHRDRQVNLEVIDRLSTEHKAVLADRAAKQAVIDRLVAQLAALGPGAAAA